MTHLVAVLLIAAYVLGGVAMVAATLLDGSHPCAVDGADQGGCHVMVPS